MLQMSAWLRVEGKVEEKPTAMLLDSGAALTLIPPELTEASDYTGKRRTVMGATGPRTFPTSEPPGKEDTDDRSCQRGTTTASVGERFPWILPTPR